MPTKFDPKIHHRKSIRLPGYDYSQAGAHFVTVVTWRRDCLFGDVVNAEMQLNDFGKIADECWHTIPEHFPNVELGVHVIMPNHGHGIIVIRDSSQGTEAWFVGANIGAFKSAVSYRINKEHNDTGIWQRNYYERIIRNEREMDAIWRYIEANPVNWGEDEGNPQIDRRGMSGGE